MEMTTVADVHKSAPARVHSSARRNRSQSRHERHKCHKHKQRIEENELVNQVRTVSVTISRALSGTYNFIFGQKVAGSPLKDAIVFYIFLLTNYTASSASTATLELNNRFNIFKILPRVSLYRLRALMVLN